MQSLQNYVQNDSLLCPPAMMYTQQALPLAYMSNSRIIAGLKLQGFRESEVYKLPQLNKNSMISVNMDEISSPDMVAHNPRISQYRKFLNLFATNVKVINVHSSKGRYYCNVI